MISLNLLPDSKLEHLQGVRKQRRISALCFAAVAAGVALPIILVVVWGGQKALLSIVQDNIDKKIEDLQAIDNIEQILTVQNQLHALPGLYDQRLYYTTLLDALPALLPTDAHLSSISLNESNELEISGLAGSAATVNNFLSILDNAQLREADGQNRAAFTSVSLGDIQPGDSGVTFSVTLIVDTALLGAKLDPDLVLNDKILRKGTGETTSDQTATPTEEDPTTSGNSLLPEEAQP